jgi:hypothetical protein
MELTVILFYIVVLISGSLLLFIGVALSILIATLITRHRPTVFQVTGTTIVLIIAAVLLIGIIKPSPGSDSGLRSEFFLAAMLLVGVLSGSILSTANKRIALVKKPTITKAIILASLSLLMVVTMYMPFHASNRTELGLHDDTVVSMTTEEKQARKEKIEAIYSKIIAGEAYVLKSETVVGEKVLYGSDKTRSRSSLKVYTGNMNVDKAAADLKQKIESVGYVSDGEQYNNQNAIGYHFKSTDNTYVRLSVTGRTFNEVQETLEDLNKIDPNSGPVEVKIRVNIDDNNE